MTIARVQFHSKTLDRVADYIAILPDPALVGPGPYPVLVQLHGYLDDHTAWLYKSMLLEHLDRYPMITILPNTQNGWWANMGYPNNWERYLVEDLVAHVRHTFPAQAGRWAIGGLSMGGFGALSLGLRYPEIFCSVWAHSSAIFHPDAPMPGPFPWNDPRLTEAEHRRLKVDLSCYHWASVIDREKLPRLTFDCGTEDFLIEANRAFHAYLGQLDLPHTYAEHPGAHTWDYWNTHVVSAIQQHAEVFGITRAPEPVWGGPSAD
jgi:putative tributyrin esterase